MTTPAAFDRACMKSAYAWAELGTCDRKQVGALLIRDGVPISHGWNGAARGEPHCGVVGHKLQPIDGRDSCTNAVHAEANAIFNAGRAGGRSTVGATLYTTAAPCRGCGTAIIQAGIVRVVYAHEYGNDCVDRLRARGIIVEQLA